MGCDTEKYHQSPHVQAGYSAWSNSNSSIKFLTEWLSWCTNTAVITDNPNIYGKPNLPGFRDHRHDQSILSNLTTKKGLTLFGPKLRSLSGYRNFNFILRHMALEQSYKIARSNFNIIFTQPNPEIPAGLEEYLSLQFITDLKKGDSVLIDSDMDAFKWRKALPSSNIDLYSVSDNKLINNTPLMTNHYSGIFFTKTPEDSLNAKLLGQLYSSLKPGGCLVLGTYQSSALDTDAKKSFAQLINWLDSNQRLPEFCGEKKDQRQNSLTLGNALNPLQMTTNNGELSYAVLIKPKMYVGEELQ